MSDSLEHLRRQCRGSADAVRWACVLEATAPKVGNVHPSRRFEDLCYSDFVLAAEVAAGAFQTHPKSFSRAVELAAKSIAEAIGTNVNLGILLLLGPLIQAESNEPTVVANSETWVAAIATVLSSLNKEDTSRLYSAINVSNPGGMGESESMDLRQTPPESFLAAMDLAKDRDRIALNYCVCFQDLFENVVPVVRAGAHRCGDVLAGVAEAHLELLAASPDSLITRKFGASVAADIQRRAALARGNPQSVGELDVFLRGEADGNDRRINPGTTADLIAAALYVLLRENG